jgi:hypothetical protein
MVASLALAALVALACAAPPQETPMNDKVDPELLELFKTQPGGRYGVIVVFAKAPDERVLDDMDLSAVPPNEATGQLTREQIETLAKRSDVSRIRSRPRPKAL